ncbi:hypothetical protein NESM_000285900 [Novymonas esmeraldas]|uniref:Uncharacterized protein n=1 Tax=Novymonas esmeraldas TaxID=1808958 RepID=A0AAW0F7N9_9TRYP
MGATPSREAKPTIRSLRYGNHEIGLIPITRAYFNDNNPQLRQQFIRVRNDPNVRYSHTRQRGYGMDELPPANYGEADLEALLDSVERSLFDTNEEMINAGALQVPTLSMSYLQHMMRCDGDVDVYDPALEKSPENSGKRSQPPTSVAPFSLGAVGTPSQPPGAAVFLDLTSPQNAYPSRETTTWLRSTSLSMCASSSDEAENNGSFLHQSATVSLNTTASNLLLPPTTPEVPPAPPPPPPPPTPAAAKMPSAEDCATDWFLKLKGHLQTLHRRVDETCRSNGCDPHSDHGAPPCPESFYKSEPYQRFKRAVRPVPCAVVFIYVNSREEHDCFTFQGHRVNVIGSFDLRSVDEDRDDVMPTLQIRKAILKAAGDRTLERVLALSTKYYMDSFTEIVLQQLQRRPVEELLAGLGEEARNLLCELSTGAPIDTAAAAAEGRTCVYDPISIARALFYERVTKLPLVVASPFNNYPALKFIYDFTSLTYSIESAQFVRPGDLRLCTYEREKGERGILFLFHGRALALSWLWATTQTQPSTARDSWAQYTLCEHTQSRERRVQQWLATDPRAATLLGDAVTTACFVQHLDHLHSEIVRARSTPTDDSTSWSTAQEYSHDMKLYRIFLSPLCGPLLTTVKTAKPEKPKGRSTGKRSSTASTAPSTTDGSSVSTGLRSRATSDLRLLMLGSVPHAPSANSRSGMQARGKVSPNTPLATLSVSGMTASTSTFSTSVATMGASTGASVYLTGTAHGSFVHHPSPQPATGALGGGGGGVCGSDGATRVTVPTSFMPPAAFAGQTAPMPLYFTDSLQQQQQQQQQLFTPPTATPQRNALHLLSPTLQGTPSLPQPGGGGCLSPMLLTSPPTGLSFSTSAAPWSLHSFAQQAQQSSVATSPMQPATSYYVQVASNGMQTLVPVTFAAAPGPSVPNNSAHVHHAPPSQPLPTTATTATTTTTTSGGGSGSDGDTRPHSSSQHSCGSNSVPFSGASTLAGVSSPSPYPCHHVDPTAAAAAAVFHSALPAFTTGPDGAPLTAYAAPLANANATMAPSFTTMAPMAEAATHLSSTATAPAMFYNAPPAYIPAQLFNPGSQTSYHNTL